MVWCTKKLNKEHVSNFCHRFWFKISYVFMLLHTNWQFCSFEAFYFICFGYIFRNKTFVWMFMLNVDISDGEDALLRVRDKKNMADLTFKRILDSYVSSPHVPHYRLKNIFFNWHWPVIIQCKIISNKHIWNDKTVTSG